MLIFQVYSLLDDVYIDPLNLPEYNIVQQLLATRLHIKWPLHKLAVLLEGSTLTTSFILKNISYDTNKIPLKLQPAFDQSVMVSISLHWTTHLVKQLMKMLLLQSVYFLKSEGDMCHTCVCVLAWVAWFPSLLGVEKFLW